MPRIPLALIPYALAIALTAGGYLWHLADHAGGAVRSEGVVRIGGPFALTGQDGKTVRDTDFRGRYMLIYFGYTMCPDVCPTELAVMAEALAKLGPVARRVVPIFITIDPERDTPALLKSYLKVFGPGFVGLTGTQAEIRTAADAYQVRFKTYPLEGGGYGMDHSSVIYLMGPDGRFVSVYTEGSNPDDIADDLKARP